MVPDNNYWNDRWKRGETGWDLGGVSPPLKHIIDQLTDNDCRILIPGCGNGYEAGYLLDQGFTNITVIDIALLPTEKLKAQYAAFLGKQLTVLHQDFFTLAVEYDLILEQTFFCALDPLLRPAYVQQMKKLLRTGGRLAGVLFNKIFDKAGPPFGGSKAEYLVLFSKDFEILRMESSLHSVAPRAGTELVVEMRRI
ncbi:MAG: methyltransferase domain-containing protein [Flavihumibacter sp.]